MTSRVEATGSGMKSSESRPVTSFFLKSDSFRRGYDPETAQLFPAGNPQLVSSLSW